MRVFGILVRLIPRIDIRSRMRRMRLVRRVVSRGTDSAQTRDLGTPYYYDAGTTSTGVNLARIFSPSVLSMHTHFTFTHGASVCPDVGCCWVGIVGRAGCPRRDPRSRLQLQLQSHAFPVFHISVWLRTAPIKGKKVPPNPANFVVFSYFPLWLLTLSVCVVVVFFFFTLYPDRELPTVA